MKLFQIIQLTHKVNQMNNQLKTIIKSLKTTNLVRRLMKLKMKRMRRNLMRQSMKRRKRNLMRQLMKRRKRNLMRQSMKRRKRKKLFLQDLNSKTNKGDKVQALLNKMMKRYLARFNRFGKNMILTIR